MSERQKEVTQYNKEITHAPYLSFVQIATEHRAGQRSGSTGIPYVKADIYVTYKL